MSDLLPEFGGLEKITIGVKSNASIAKTFTLKGTMVNIPFVSDNSGEYDFSTVNIPTGVLGGFGALAQNKLYIPVRGSNYVSVINTSNDTVITTIATGVKPFFILAYGAFVYVSGGDDTGNGYVHIINPLTDTIVSTISTEGFGTISLAGTKLVCSNYSLNPNLNITVINLITNIALPPVASTVLTYDGAYNALTNTLYLSGNTVFTSLNLNTMIATVHSTGVPLGAYGFILYDQASNQIIVSSGNTGFFVLYFYNASTFTLNNTYNTGYQNGRMIIVDRFLYICTINNRLLKFSIDTFSLSGSVTVGNLPLVPVYDPMNNLLLVPCSGSSRLDIVRLSDFQVENMITTGPGTNSVVVQSESSFYTVNYNAASTATHITVQPQVVFILEDGITIEQLSQQWTYQPMCIDKMIVDNLDDTDSLRNGLVYGVVNPSGDSSKAPVSLLQFFTAAQRQNLVEFSGDRLPSCIIDGMHYLQGVIEPGETMNFTFWFHQLDSSLPLGGSASGSIGAKAPANSNLVQVLKTGVADLYEEPVRSSILAIVKDKDPLIIIIRRKSK